MRKYCVLFVVISILGFTQLFAQDKTKRSEDIFRGKWFGSIKYDAEIFDNKGKISSHHTSSLKNIIIIAEEFDDENATPVEMLKSIGMDDHTAEWMSKMRNPFGGDAVYTGISQYYDSNGKLFTTWKLINGIENIEISGHFCSNNRIWISSDSEVQIWLGTYSAELSPFSLGGALYGLLFLEGMNFEINDNRLLINFKEILPGKKHDCITVTGELSRVYIKPDTLGKTLHIDEVIKTDEFTRRDIVVPDVGKVIVKPNSKCKFKKDKLLDQAWGEIISKIKPGGNYKVRIPKTAACAVRGTQFITKVEKDGATTLTVLDGEVEFSDTEKRKTVLVKKNQRSTIRSGELPSEPVPIDSSQIPIWWE